MGESNVLYLDGFGIAFGERVVLRTVNLSVSAVGCTVLLGPSGTGKSTLLRTLAGFNTNNPAVRTWGHALYRKRPCTALHHPALVMQNSKLLVSNVLENLVCELPGRSSLTQRMQIEMVSELLRHHGHTPLLDGLSQKVIELTPGEQRVIAILRRVMADPALLLVDEPTTGLQPAQARTVLQLLEQVCAERALLVVLHHLQQARDLGGQVALLANGVIEESDESDTFFSAPRSDCAKAFLQTGSCPEASRPESEEAAAPDRRTTQRQRQSPAEPEPDEAAAPDPSAGAGNEVTPEAPAMAPVARSAAWGPRGFLWLLPGQLAGTPWPGVVHNVRYDLEALRSVGITRLVSLTEEPFNAALAGEFGISCLASPMPDMAPPTLEQGLVLCRAIDRALAAGEVVAVHCHAGLGRTGTVLAAYWLWRGGGRIGAPQALEDVRRIEPGWVQSQAQVRFLEEFARVVANGGAVAASLSNDPEVVPVVAASVT